MREGQEGVRRRREISLSFWQLARFSSLRVELKEPSAMCLTPRSESLEEGEAGGVVSDAGVYLPGAVCHIEDHNSLQFLYLRQALVRESRAACQVEVMQVPTPSG